MLETQQGTPGAAWQKASYCLITVVISAAKESAGGKGVCLTLNPVGRPGEACPGHLSASPADSVWVWILAEHRQVSATQTPCDLEWRCYQRCGLSVLDFMQERFHNTSASDFENTLIKAGDSETKEG